ncbi:Cof-type HAD-IIB family hydrolase [Lactococcus lactis]|uniref:Cof-type HAD-IIB family hydrolase n=1 Tax=Lactococcus lactis TaxID=1358 RepID=UPI0003BA1840|nr:Cof-type HAD-IIB family hydrolase [Lactococcus lactis]AGY45620.1 HAD family hydrolase [Lactococcus lactis subsp. lactis KLDS 4.0325]KSU17499.1 Hydrolase (HAD superfamily) [Lactococcus lactis subsp. lactis]MCT3124916.1 HAD family hydrolase [Lactococcus lactis]MCX7529809.1 Cof-type HAD-IIB family hydrolase [Lactococcus lactis]MDM7472814.1 Cof-type HAD-IIB family hydrolase [Lactococcus lactis]
MIKAIAVDMDGTFLNSNNDYDRKAFLELFKKLKAKEVRFVVASGNQYAQISSFFPEIWREITFVSENGGLVFEKGNLLIKNIIAKPIIQDTLTLLENTSYKVGIILCGVQSAYILKSKNADLKKEAAKYYFALKEIDSFQDLPDDEWVKIALQLEDKNAFSIINLMNEKNNSQLKAVYSGHGSVDLIANEVNKGNTLKQLLNQREIKPEQFLAFGDSNNDLEMLELAGYSYSMANASEQVNQVAKYQAPSNDENGVISTINALFDKLG